MKKKLLKSTNQKSKKNSEELYYIVLKLGAITYNICDFIYFIKSKLF